MQEVSNILQAAQEASENVLEEVSNTVEAAQTSSAHVLQEVSDTLQEHQASSTQMAKSIISDKQPLSIVIICDFNLFHSPLEYFNRLSKMWLHLAFKSMCLGEILLTPRGLQGDPSGWLKPPVDLILTFMAAGGPLL